MVVNYIREFQLAAGVPRDQLYNTTMYILCAMLIAGLICNYLIKPVDKKWHMSEAEVAKLQAATASAGASGPSGSYGIGFGGLDVKETAEVMKVSPDTAIRDWKVAKVWLLRELHGGAARGN